MTNVITVGNEPLQFIRRPELGYVVKSQEQTTAIEALDGTLKEFGALDIRPVRGLGRRGVSVVFSERPADENENTIAVLRTQSRIRYAAPLFSSNGETVAIIPEIVVRVTAETSAEQLETLCQTMDLATKRRLEFTDCEYLVEVLGTDASAVFGAVEQLNQILFIEWAVPNIAFRPRLCGQVIPNDTYFRNQWHLNNTGQSGGTPDADINAPEAWEITTADPNIVVAVVDSGVDTDHPDLINNIVPGYDFYDGDNSPEPYGDDAHGTACAGLIAAQGNNGLGVTGVTWNCKIMPIRIANWAEAGFITEADVARAFRWAAQNGADVLSNSWGSFWPLPVVRSAIAAVTAPGGTGRDGKGCVVLAASGNWPSGGPIWYPAEYPEVIAVGATNHNDVVWDYSGHGPELDIVAPSGAAYARRTDFSLWTTDIAGSAGWNKYNRNPYILDYMDQMGGTSGACPIAAGVAALTLSVDPNLTNIQVQSILQISATDLGEPRRDDYYGYGRLDARAALALAQALPQTLFVDDNAPDDPGPGDPAISDPLENGSAEHPFDAIQEAIDFTIIGETVIVLPGTYTGDGNRDIDFGGKAMTLRSTNPNMVAATIIDCNGTEAEPHRGFYFRSGEDANSVLDGLTITNSYAGQGGGIYCVGSSPTVTNCTFRGNIGGGMCNYDRSSPTLTNCTFSGNSAVYKGGGMFNYCSGPTLTNCAFSGNSARRGGGMYSYWSNDDYGIPTLTNCTFSGNSAGSEGGGMYNTYSSPTLTNCILWGNTAPRGSQIYKDGTGLAAVTYSDIQGGWSGTGNIDEDPLFVDADGPDSIVGTEDDNLRLLAGSPCIDAGDNTAVPSGVTTDLELEPRFIDDPNTPDTGNGTPPIVDMGAYESPDQGFLLSTKSVTVPEGETATFTVALALDPLGTIEATVTVESDDPDITVHSEALLTFDSSNYSQPQTVTVAAAEDEDQLESTARIRIIASGELFAGVIVWEIENDVAAVLFVDSGSNGVNDGSSWSDAFNELQDAMTLATGAPRAVDEIRVAEGIYKPDQGAGVTPGDREAAFQLISGVAIKGGYAGFCQPDPNARDIDVYETVLSGDLNGDDEPNFANNDENSYHVVIGTGTDKTAVLDGTTITAGDANEDYPSPHASGGGMFNDSGSPTLTNCTFSRNWAENGGGGMFNDNASPTLTHCTFSRNWAENGGGGMFNDSGSPTLTNCTFSRNWAENEGGGMFNENSSPTMTNCMFSANSARWDGGGMNNYESSPMITNCTFSGNSAVRNDGGGMNNYRSSSPVISNCTFSGNSANDWGGGMRNVFSSSPTISNCAFVENFAKGDGGGLFNYDDSNPVITNCTFAGNSAPNGRAFACDSWQGHWSSVRVSNCILWDGGDEIWNNDNSVFTITYSNIEGGWPGEGNIDADPCFVEPGYWDPNGTPEDPNDDFWVDGDYHLRQDSPCINAGDPNYAAEPNETDLDGRPRIIVGRVDIGAYEFNHIPIADAGLAREVYAWIDGIAEVTLNGTGSYDDDGQLLTYLWSWTIDGQTYDANGVTPTIELPVGEQTIELIVNDGIDDSEPNEVVIIVVEPIEVAMKFTPQALNPSSRGKWVKAQFVLPAGFMVEDVDAGRPAKIEPLGIESEYINVFINEDGLVEIEAAFGRATFCGAATDYGPAEVTVAGLLASGQYFYGTDTIKIINKSFEYLGVLASYWLEGGCGAPDWCGCVDLDHNSVVDFVDFAMFDGCCIEVIRQ